ncbi:DoxX family protein [Streptomyces sp. RKAG293]|uniref:DoxX family protein n=1 Tax=Streptomyces sp. RKAG293 TaxID=2893403 RepID=UPI002034560D|nr:DoxX family protein [Streptomyces sp. RKAG293]MCM2416551.1 DoxX family protein [Streptomyces sp. RKAG293]
MSQQKLWPHALSAFRVIVGALFFCHGASSVFGWFGGAMGHGGTIATGTWPGWWAALIQLVGGALVALGLVTRAAALLCSGSMAYAYFSVHQQHALLPIQNNGEPSVMFCWTFLLIAFAGPGTWALDTILTRGRQMAARAELTTDRVADRVRP